MPRIAEFRSSEYGTAWGRPGDQVMPKKPGETFDGEVRIRYYIDGGFTVIYRPIRISVAESIAYNMEAAALNPNVGYSQNNGDCPRESFYYALQNAGGDAAKIDEPCNSDCSAGTAALLKNAGVDVPLSMWTGTAPVILEKTRAFLSLDIDPDDKRQEYYLLRGDILYRPGHMAIVIEDGSYMHRIPLYATGDVWQRLLPGTEPGTQLRAIARGDRVNGLLPAVDLDDRLWYMTEYNGRRGWTSSRYLKPAKVVEATASVYVRYLPKVGSAIMTVLHAGDRLAGTDTFFVDSRNVAWYQVVIDADESLGWVSSKYSKLFEE